MIFCPPRVGKSTMVTVRHPLYCLERNPSEEIMVISYKQDLADKFSRQTRRLATSRDIQLSRERHAVRNWETQQGGSYRAAGINAGVTGEGATRIYIDDPIKGRDQADSLVIREKVWEAWTDDIATRRNPGCKVVLILCLTGDTPVLLPNGTERPLRDIRPGDAIATYSNGGITTSTVRKWASQGHDDVFTIRTESGRVVTGNARHPFLVQRGSERLWKRISELEVGDLVIGANTVASSAATPTATSQPSVAECATSITGVSCGHKDTGLRPTSMWKPASAPRSSSTMDLTTTIIAPCLQHKTDAVPFAANSQPYIPPPFGEESYAWTTTTSPEKCAACCATIATGCSQSTSRPSDWKPQQTTYECTTDKIVSITPAGRQEVFDIQVEGTENFIAAGLVAHNTRWHEDDLAGRILNSRDAPNWRVVSLPMVAEQTTYYELTNWTRQKGDLLNPVRYPAHVVEKIKDGPERTYQSLYQQNPSRKGGNIFRASWFQYYYTPPIHFDEIIQSWDMAFKEGESTSKVAGHVYGRLGADVYLLRRHAKRMDIVESMEAVIFMTAAEPRARLKLIEDKANGPAIIRLLHKKITGLVPQPVEGSKEQRAISTVPFCQSGNVYFPHPSIAPWVDEVIEQLKAFPRGSEDDDVDAFTQAVNYLLGKGTTVAEAREVARKIREFSGDDMESAGVGGRGWLDSDPVEVGRYLR